MLSKTLILLAVTSLALAIPQDPVTPSSPESTTTLEFADVNDLLAALALIPILPPPTQEALASIPEADLTSPEVQCNPSSASWFSDLPTDIQTELTTYVDAVQSWVVAHPDIVKNYAASLPAGFGLCENKEDTTSSTSSGTASSTSSVAESEATSTELATSSAITSSGLVITSSSFTTLPSSTAYSNSTIATPTPTEFSTSTIFATITSTISSCASSITDCPYGSVTTVTIPISTTICPITNTGIPYQTQSEGSEVQTSVIEGVVSGTAPGVIATSTSAPFEGGASHFSGTMIGGLVGLLSAGVMALL